jgi:hypothetical protein
MKDEIRREIRRQTRFLRGYAILMTAAAAVFSLAAFRGEPGQRQTFGEIDVERKNGGLTITGSRDSLGHYRATSSWSFDQFDQDQILTLQYIDNNGQRRTGLTVADRADRNIYDLVMQRDSINAIPDTAARRVAMEKLMGPVNGVPLAATRLHVGRDVGKNAVVNLFDPLGRIRLRMRVDSLGRASLDFMDDRGRVTFSVPDSVRR